MRLRLPTRGGAWLPALAALALAAASSAAQTPVRVIPTQHAAPNCPTPVIIAPSTPQYAPLPAQPWSPAPQQVQPAPVPEAAAPAAPAPAPSAASPALASAADPGFSAGTGGSVGGSSFAAPGYVDPALIATQVRVRFDAGYGINRPDRAEFFYAKCGCFRAAPNFDNTANGLPLAETRVDYQDITTTLEIAGPNRRASVFLDLPVRFLNPERNENNEGVGDINLGFKYALRSCEDSLVTFQFRTYIPTGQNQLGLGTNHVSLEPGFLFYRNLGEGLGLHAELRDWIGLEGNDYTGNVLRYGVGLTYDLFEGESIRLSPVLEMVGWTVLDGRESAPTTTDPRGRSVAGTTIFNAKVGARLTIDDRHSLYFGYGRALTGAMWYEDILRMEYRLLF